MSGFSSMLNTPSVKGVSTTSKVKYAKHSAAKSSTTNGQVVHQSAGVPDNSLSFLHNLSSAPQSQQNTQGVQAVSQGNQATQVGGGQLDTQSNQAVAAGAVALIDIATVAAELRRNEPTRKYIGASGIGTPCMALLALSLRGFPGDTPSPQLLRIFGDGNRIETLVVEALVASGHKVEELDPATGKQWHFTSHGDHHAANLDGFITLVGSSERMTLEIKSMNRKSFESFQKKGLALSHPHYYDQVTDGLYLAKLNCVTVEKCFVIAYCKDNSAFHAEVIEYDADQAIALIDKVDTVLLSGGAERAGSYAKEFLCAGCFKRTSCWNPNVTDRHCSHCAWAEPLTDRPGKQWYCTIHKRPAMDECSAFKLFKPMEKA